MKYKGKRKSGADKDVDVYIIAIGSQELRLLIAVLESSKKCMPRLFETIPTHGRLRNMLKVLKAIKQEHLRL